FLRQYDLKAGSSLAHAFTHLDFENAARRYGKVGGFAHLATLVKRLRASRPLALPLDGGDSWQGSATSLWTRGADMIGAQRLLGEVRAKGAKAVVLLSHNGMDVDLKLASRVRGLDAILGGHTHDAVPAPVRVGGTLVTSAGCCGKFLAVLDLQVGALGVTDYRYRLLPVFSNLLPADEEMRRYIARARAPYEGRLQEKLAVTEGLLYRRGNFNGSFDQLLLDP